jgi:DNA primase
VAWPVTWAGLGRVAAPNGLSIGEARRRLGKADPWAGYGEVRQGLKASAKRALGLKE